MSGLKDKSEYDGSTYLEYMLPYQHEDYDGLLYLTIDFGVDSWFFEKHIEPYTSDYDDYYPPAEEEACRDLAEHFEKNYSQYFQRGLVQDCYNDEDISSPEELKAQLEAGKLRFIF